MACTSGISARLSWVLAAEVATANGRPVASVSTGSLAPGLPRSTSAGPLSAGGAGAALVYRWHSVGPAGRRQADRQVRDWARMQTAPVRRWHRTAPPGRWTRVGEEPEPQWWQQEAPWLASVLG